MGRLILAALLAPVFWGILLVPGNLLLMRLFPDALTTQPPQLGYLLTALLASFLYGVFAGFCSAWTAGERASQAGVWAGVVLLAVGIGVQTANWALLPVWWHLCFLIAIIPMAIVGARLHTVRSN